MASVTYPAPTGDFGDVATIVVNGNHVRVLDSAIAAAVGSGNAVTFTASFDLVMGLGSSVTHTHWSKGQTYVVNAATKAALVAASAPMTVH
jgi:hypothetical protein